MSNKKRQLQEEGNRSSSVHSHHGKELTYLGAAIASPLAKRVLNMNDDDDDDHHHHHVKKHRSSDKHGGIKHDEESDHRILLTKTKATSSPSSSTMTVTKQQPRRQHNYQVRSLTALYRDNRRTNDEIHSSISLGPVVTCILDTPPMQRLRGLKQLGCAEYVYINVNHNRFEHSLGVATLAETLCRKIRIQQPSLQCTEKDVLCVQLAGTCEMHRNSVSIHLYVFVALFRTHQHHHNP